MPDTKNHPFAACCFSTPYHTCFAGRLQVPGRGEDFPQFTSNEAPRRLYFGKNMIRLEYGEKF
jgi:hypothetical protein